jgi:hypothetical protein
MKFEIVSHDRTNSRTRSRHVEILAALEACSEGQSVRIEGSDLRTYAQNLRFAVARHLPGKKLATSKRRDVMFCWLVADTPRPNETTATFKRTA